MLQPLFRKSIVVLLVLEYVQHSAAVNPGNSGGALLDEGGRLVGIVTLGTYLNNISFAIPVETVRKNFQGP